MIKKGVVLVLLIFCSFIRAEDKRFVIVICSYNNSEWIKKNLDSVFRQTYKNWRIIYTDDQSTDNTYSFAHAYSHAMNLHGKVKLIHNKNRKKALANLYHAIHLCKPNEIVVVLDGDDFLANNNVLAYLNDVYQDPNIWLTYGQFEEYPSGNKGWCVAMPDEVIANNAFRDFTHGPSHLRTFYAGLFHKIKKEDLLYNGDFFAMTYDLAIMYPMIEMARLGHFKFIDEILLTYNTVNSLNDHKVDANLQGQLAQIIRKKDRYEALQALF